MSAGRSSHGSASRAALSSSRMPTPEATLPPLTDAPLAAVNTSTAPTHAPCAKHVLVRDRLVLFDCYTRIKRSRVSYSMAIMGLTNPD